MTRKLTAAALALTVMGGVYLVAAPAQASNMGFKLERSLKVERENPADRLTNFNNLYLVQFPLFSGLGDVGHSTAPETNKCVGDTGGPAAGDGIIDLTDGICDLWTDRNIIGSFAIYYFNRDTCQFISRTAANAPFVGISFGGDLGTVPTMTGPGERDMSYLVSVGSNLSAPPLPVNRAVIVGSHDPSFTGRQIRQPTPDCLPRNDYINVPLHTMYKNAYEILCGLEGVDWVDLDGNGPDTCTAGIYDGTRAIQVLTFDNTNDDSIIPDNAWTFASVVFNAFPPPGRNTFGGVNFPLVPGDGYKVGISAGHVTTTFLSPHF